MRQLLLPSLETIDVLGSEEGPPADVGNGGQPFRNDAAVNCGALDPEGSRQLRDSH